MTYDEALARLRQIVKEVETTQALSIADYRVKYEEAQKLIKFCKEELGVIEKQTREILNMGKQ